MTRSAVWCHARISFGGAALATFVQVLDTTTRNVSLPTVAGNLGVSSDTSTWIVTAFAIANGAVVPLTGWLMDRFGVIRTFCLSVPLFTLASILCGIACNLPSLIAFACITADGFAASLITTGWDRREALHHGRLSKAVGSGMPYQLAGDALAQLGLTDTQAAGAVTRQLVGQTYLLASTDLFRLSAWLCAVLVIVVGFTRRPSDLRGPIAAD